MKRTVIKPNADFEQKFWSHVVKGADNECWNWKGYVNKGYGTFWINKGNMRAHRAAWVIHNGPIPDRLFVCHKCDNRSCVNPNHLFLGTNMDNIKDMVDKKRHAYGQRHGCVKLKLTDVLAIRVMFIKRGFGTKEIGRRFDVSATLVGDIIKGKQWAKGIALAREQYLNAITAPVEDK